jgi:hypothetical protein
MRLLALNEVVVMLITTSRKVAITAVLVTIDEVLSTLFAVFGSKKIDSIIEQEWEGNGGQGNKLLYF